MVTSLWRRTSFLFFSLLGFQLLLSTYRLWSGVPFPYSPPLFWPGDRFMDFFNTNYWSTDGGRYSTWHSTYPPFAFLVARFFALMSDYASGSVAARASLTGTLSLIPLFTILALVLWWSAGEFTTALAPGSGARTTILVFLSLAVSTPVVFTVDRGNYVICTAAFLVLHLRAERRHSRLSILWLACAASLKPYLLLCGALFLGKWRQLAYFVGVTMLINVLSIVVLGESAGLQFMGNFLRPLPVGEDLLQTYASVSLPNLLVVALHLLNLDPSFGTMRPPYLMLAVSVVTGLALYCRAADWEDLLFVVILAAVIIPNNSLEYNLLLLYPLASRVLRRVGDGRTFAIAWVFAVLAVCPFNVFTGFVGMMGDGSAGFPLRLTEQVLIVPLALLTAEIAYCRGIARSIAPGAFLRS